MFGGLILVIAGVLAFRHNDVFSATGFTIYGLFWLNQTTFGVLVLTRQIPVTEIDANQAWMWLAGAIFTIYMLAASVRISAVTFITFAALAVTYILLAPGFFQNAMPGQGLVSLGGYAGIVAGLLAWYGAAAELAREWGHPGRCPWAGAWPATWTVRPGG